MKYGLGFFAAFFLLGCTADENIESAEINPTLQTAEAVNPIYVNQHGFAPDGPKLAFYRGALKQPVEWTLHNQDGDIIEHGKTRPLGYSKTADQVLNEIEFSDFDTLGENYYLTVEGIKGPTFDIAKGLYKSLKFDVLAYFYHARAGEPIKAPYVARKHTRPAGHTKEVVTCFKGKDMWGTEWPGCDYALDVTGGWYDAGDHGKYIVNSGISTWTLLNAYEQFGEDFADGKVNIPEAGNGVNDLLDEARKNIEWMLSMQVPQGTKMMLPVGKQETGKPLNLTEVDASGMVHHKVHDEFWTSGTTMPHQDKETRYLYPPSTGATLNVAAIGSQCARIWRQIDIEFSERCAEASENAFSVIIKGGNWSDLDFIEVYGQNNFDCGGPYGDISFIDEITWASSELDTLKSSSYYSHIEHSAISTAGFDSFSTSTLGFNSTFWLGIISEAPYSKELLQKKADEYLLDTAKEKLHFPFYAESYKWGGNGAMANRAIVLGTAYQLTGERKYRDGVVHLMDYLLGRNPTGYSYITGYGDKPFKNPHHRFWAKQLDETRPEPPAGILSGGPNNDNMSDPVAKTMIGTCAPQTCYADDHGAWTLNEVTINWNAPLFWMAAFLDATEE